MIRARSEGFALLAALMSVLLFATIAYRLTARATGAVTLAQAEVDRARLEWAARGAMVMAIDGLSREKGAGRWDIDGRARPLMFGGVPMRVTLEDERGKIPLNDITAEEAQRMFELAGADRRLVPVLVDSFLDWRDDDDEVRPNGAENAYYARFGLRARNGELRGVEELALIRGMTPALYAKLAPATTVYFGESGGFSVLNAQPLAISVMAPDEAGSEAVTARRRELSGALSTRPRAEVGSYVGRAVTVRVEAEGLHGSRLERAWVVELTGDKTQPFWIRARL